MRLKYVLTASLLLSACATTPDETLERPISNGAAIARTVQLCETTFTELKERLGEPSRDGVLGKDRVVTWIVDWDPLTKYLGVLLDRSGTVVDVYWNLPSEVTWTPTNRCK